MCRIRFVVLAVLAVALALPGAAAATSSSTWGLNDSQEPGSVLVFPKFIGRETVRTRDQGELPRSEFEISVSCPKGFNCSSLPTFPGDPGPNPTIRLMAHWVCEGDPFRIGGEGSFCEERDFELRTTVNGTVYFHASGSAPVNVPGATPVIEPSCERGYLIVWVINRDGDPIKFDGLVGDAVIRRERDDQTAGAYKAIPIQASEDLYTGERTDVDGGHDLDFNGREYKMVTGKILETVRYPGEVFTDPDGSGPLPPVQTGFIRTRLNVMTLDVRSNRFDNDIVSLDLDFYNEREDHRSGTLPFVCWGQADLNDDLGIDNTFGRKGLLESEPAELVDGTRVTVLGVLEIQELDRFDEDTLREYWLPLLNDSTPVETTFVPDGGGTNNTNTSPPPGSMSTITFDDYNSGQSLNGEYPSGVANWGSDAWYLSGPWGGFSTNSISFSGSGVTSESFTFVSPKRLVSLMAYNGGAGASTITISCSGNPTKTVTVNAGQLVTISTGWSNACSTVTIGSSNGWDTNFDDLTYQ